MPRDNDPRRNVKPDDSAAYDTALTEIYGSKEELNALGAQAQQAGLQRSIEHLGTANELSNQLAAQDQAAQGKSSANRQALYSQDIASSEAQGALREQYSMEGASALRTARDNQLAGYDLELANLSDDSANQQQSAYNAALGSMYSKGSSAGFAKQADQSLADTAGRAGSDLNTQIQKTTLGRSSTAESFEHRLTMAEMQRDMDIQQVRQQVDRLRTQSGAERDDNEYRLARAELSLQLQNSVSDNNIAIQEQALGLAQASEPLEAKIFINENVSRLDRKSSNTFEEILMGSN